MQANLLQCHVTNFMTRLYSTNMTLNTYRNENKWFLINNHYTLLIKDIYFPQSTEIRSLYVLLQFRHFCNKSL